MLLGSPAEVARVFLAFWPKCVDVFQDVVCIVLRFGFHQSEDVLQTHFPMAPSSILCPLSVSDLILGILSHSHSTNTF